MTHRIGQGRYVSAPAAVPAGLIVAGCACLLAAYGLAPPSTWPERRQAAAPSLPPGSAALATAAVAVSAEATAQAQAPAAAPGAQGAQGAQDALQAPLGAVASPGAAVSAQEAHQPGGGQAAIVPALPAVALVARDERQGLAATPGAPREPAAARSRPLTAAAPTRDPRVMTRPNPDAPLQTGWILVDDDTPGGKIARPARPARAGGGAAGGSGTEPDAGDRAPAVAPAIAIPAGKTPIVSFEGLDFIEQAGQPAVQVAQGALTFSEPGTGLVYAPVPSADRQQAASNYSVGFEARTETGAWQLAVDADPAADREADRAGTVVEYRVGESPSLRVTRGGRKLVSSAAYQVDLNWHAVRALLAPTSMSLYVDRNQVLVISRTRPTPWIGLGGAGEFRSLEVRAR